MVDLTLKSQQTISAKGVGQIYTRIMWNTMFRTLKSQFQISSEKFRTRYHVTLKQPKLEPSTETFKGCSERKQEIFELCPLQYIK